MNVIVNGHPFAWDASRSLAELLQELGRPMAQVAVEHNGQVLTEDQFSAIRLCPGDRLEIVHFVGGG
jgi:sulfur carrier protein